MQNLFNQLINANINRKEFSDALAKSCENIEKYIKELEEEISKEQEKLNTLYDEFAKKTGEYSFIFEEEKIKNLIISKLLQS